MTPWTAAYQALPSMGFSRQEYWSESPVPSLKHTAGLCKERILQVQELKYLDRPHPTPTPIQRISRRSHHSKKNSSFFPSLILANQITLIYGFLFGFPGNSDGKVSACHVGAPGSIPGLGRSSGERNGYPFQYSCLENSMDRGAWKGTINPWDCKESYMTE